MNAPFAAKRLDRSRPDADKLVLAPSLERRRLQSYLGLMLGDILALLFGSFLAGYAYLGPEGADEALSIGQLLLPLFLTIALYNGAYSIDALRDPWRGIFRAGGALFLSAAALVFFAFYTKSSADFSRAAFSICVLMSGALLSWTRLQMRSFVRWRCGSSAVNEVVIDDGGPPIELEGAIRVDARELGLRPDLQDPHALDRIGLVLRNIDRVVVSCPQERRAAWSMMFKGANIEGEVLADEVIRLGAHGARVAGGHGLLMVSSGPLGLRARAMKRLLDVALASAASLVLAPVFVAVAIAIKLEDGGPVFFVQKRMGRGNRFFDMYKFRSMTVVGTDREGTISASKTDRRITRTGRFIRRTSLDELPQLINVIAGDMSRSNLSGRRSAGRSAGPRREGPRRCPRSCRC